MSPEPNGIPSTITPGDYTPEELQVLAALRRASGRTCASCAWLRRSGKQLGCYPQGKYRKWLSSVEFDAGCDIHEKRPEKK